MKLHLNRQSTTKILTLFCIYQMDYTQVKCMQPLYILVSKIKNSSWNLLDMIRPMFVSGDE